MEGLRQDADVLVLCLQEKGRDKPHKELFRISTKELCLRSRFQWEFNGDSQHLRSFLL